MIINHNLSALNAWRALSINTTNTQKSLEKLSSGYRINRASDDAAGLAISEKMRAQIRGLNQAQRNAQDGISLIQTAEGALNEVHSILQRMRELAVQAANDTNTVADRAELQKEVDQLAQEITRIGENTEFNTQKLLNGTYKGTFHIGANENQNISLNIGDMRAYNLGVVGDAKIEVTATVTDGGDLTTDIADGTYTVKYNDSTGKYELLNANGVAVATSTNGKDWTATVGDDTLTFSEAVISGNVTIASGTATATGTVDNGGLQAGEYTYVAADSALKDSNGNVVATTSDGITFVDASGATVLTFGAALTDGEEISIGGVDISDQAAANAAITTINNAIEAVSAERSKLGAYQNRLEHTINNLSVASENLTAAESRIRDVDMAKEMMEFTKNNILNQAATAMLAQANQLPQTILQLLR
ncbi:flagellin domain protein [Thermoanaerobacter mathranii subsp. mathranii str. A3]|uniref:Flagellin n=1 Tax=Thermoanaerobacter mathranii subsp. mathranii (strain DSM 11426 / CCUG 53645 / CIP 108742 / A3) TaxID=583358 RepID=A0ABM5LNP8_THEM3|nr:flagellin [Thermoanaerobacter mathranii]ADH60321.1 flagellin domain protein [Thermoanaerobacter mathranii subsp. mathranii str. A3]